MAAHRRDVLANRTLHPVEQQPGRFEAGINRDVDELRRDLKLLPPGRRHRDHQIASQRIVFRTAGGITFYR